MNVTIDKNDLIISDIDCFDLTHTFECGQCFRWESTADNEYIGIASSHVLKISKEANSFRLYNTSKKDFNDFWKDYFDLEFDYALMQRSLKSDNVVADAIKSGSGIRILHQDLFETIISFIISQNNNIPRIKLIIDRLCRNFGKEISTPFGKFYSFPAPEDMKNVTLSDLAFLKAGFRDKYIKDAIDKINNSDIDLNFLKTADTETAKKELLKIKGVGEKVANCILLFALHKYDSFPVDVWVKRVVSKYYFAGNEPNCDLSAFAKDKFGNYCGFAQQYLFYYERENSKKANKDKD